MKNWIIENLFTSKNKITKLPQLNGQIVTEEWFLKNGFVEEYDKILSQTTFMGDHRSLKDRLRAILLDLTADPVCKMCGNPVEYFGSKQRFREYCSRKCSTNSKEVIAKRIPKLRQTCLNKFGSTSYLSTDECRVSRENSNMKKYGVPHHMQNKDFAMNHAKKIDHAAKAELAKKTCTKKYGVTSWAKTEIGKKTLIDIHNQRSEEHKKEILDRRNKTMLEKYGRKSIGHGRQFPYIDKDFLETEYVEKKKTFEQIADEMGVCYSVIQGHIYHWQIPIRRSHNVTKPQKDILKFLHELGVSATISDRSSAIKPKELDIFVKDKQFAIEYDGNYWHSSEDCKTLKNNEEKYKMCVAANIDLLTIREDEWSNKTDIIKSIIKARLGFYDRIIHGRQCDVQLISNDVAKKFCFENHIQGHVNSKIQLGLFYKQELISVMTFGHPRYSKDYQFELYRYCNKLGYKIHGGASKLFKYFIKHFSPENIVTFSDIRLFKSSVYAKLGFNFLGITAKNLYYWHPKLKIVENRIKFQKHRLPNILKNYDENKTARENLVDNGYRGITDFGNAKYVWSGITNGGI